MTNEVEKNLKASGFKKNEIEIYLYLLENGISTPPQIAKGTRILRTNCYNILVSLREKGVIEEQKKGSRRAYLARDPQSLKLSLERRLEAIDRALPDLRALYVVKKNKPTIRFFEGFEEVKQIYGLTLSAESVYATGSTEKLRDLDAKFFADYIKAVGDKKIIFHDLLSSGAKQGSAAFIQGIAAPLYSIKFLPAEYLESLTDLLVWGDNVALIALDDPIFGTVITSSPLARTFRALLRVLWDKV